MRSLVIFGAVVVMCGMALGQRKAAAPTATELDHIAIYVRDLDKSAKFYEDVFEFKRIHDPFQDGRHVWFRIGAHDQLHVVAGETERRQRAINDHLSFRVASVPEFMKRLDAMHIPYRGIRDEKVVPTQRADGVKQIYFQDPDGYWIEVNDDRF